MTPPIPTRGEPCPFCDGGGTALHAAQRRKA